MKKFIQILLLFSILISSFSVSADNSYNESGIISLMGELEVMQGDPNGDLRLDSTVTRAEFTKMVVNASEYKNIVAINQPTSTFKDVLYTHWAAPYIRIGVKKGMITGYSDASFRPENNVLFEEALNICLKLLGYTSEDFGASWPYGQIGLSDNLGISDNVSAGMGEAISRRDAVNIIYNTLNSYKKDTNQKYISQLKYELIEDVVLIATTKEDVSVGSDKIYTTSGYFEISSDFDISNVGRRGTLIIKNNDEAVGFIPSQQTENQYSLYQILNNNIIVFENGTMKTLDVGADLTVYYKTEKHTLSSISQKVTMGDVVKIYKNSRGVYDYGVVVGNNLIGPVTVKSSSWLQQIGMGSDASVFRNGSKVSHTSVEINDIIYYSKSLNTVLAYNKKVTGIYEEAYPTKDSPTSVVVSGVTYEIEGSDAFAKLSSSGTCNIGDTVTLLMGRYGNTVADVLNTSNGYGQVYGYLVETGVKEYSSQNGNSYNSYYVKIADASKNILEFPVNSDCSQYMNEVVSVVTKSTGVTVSKKTNNSTSLGKVNYLNRKIGNYKVADDIKILDVAESTTNKVTSYVSAYLQNIDGYTLSSNDVLYCGKNSNGEISELILNDVTGETYEYGITTKAQINGNSESYTLDIYGSGVSANSSTIYKLKTGYAVKVLKNGNNIASLKTLEFLGSNVSDLTETYLTISGNRYKISAKTAIYNYSGTSGYMITNLSELISNKDEYNLKVYGETSKSSENRAWVIVATKK